MRIEFESIGNVLVIKLFGELDHHSSEDVKKKIDLEILTKNPQHLIFDMENLSFMDSSGIGVIIGRYKIISSKNGVLRLINLKPQIKRIYEICGLKKIVKCYTSKKIAIKSIKGVK